MKYTTAGLIVCIIGLAVGLTIIIIGLGLWLEQKINNHKGPNDNNCKRRDSCDKSDNDSKSYNKFYINNAETIFGSTDAEGGVPEMSIKKKDKKKHQK
jgi:hypothetical protein